MYQIDDEVLTRPVIDGACVQRTATCHITDSVTQSEAVQVPHDTCLGRHAANNAMRCPHACSACREPQARGRRRDTPPALELRDDAAQPGSLAAASNPLLRQAGLGLPRRCLPPARPRALRQHSRLLAPEGRRRGAARALQLRRGRARPAGRPQHVRLGVADGRGHLRGHRVGSASRPVCGAMRAETAVQRPELACQRRAFVCNDVVC